MCRFREAPRMCTCCSSTPSITATSAVQLPAAAEDTKTCFVSSLQQFCPSTERPHDGVMHLYRCYSIHTLSFSCLFPCLVLCCMRSFKKGRILCPAAVRAFSLCIAGFALPGGSCLAPRWSQLKLLTLTLTHLTLTLTLTLLSVSNTGLMKG